MRSIVLLSGGLDSTVSLAHAVQETEVAMCLTFDYGQRAAAKEIKAANAIAGFYNLKQKVVELPFLAEITGTALVHKDRTLPEPDADDLDDPEKSSRTAASVWVPNRNGVFVNIAAAFCEAYGCGIVVTGFNREEARTFADNSRDFVNAVNASLSFSTLNGVKVVSYTQRLDKVDIVKMGRRLKVPFHLLWSCYQGNEEICGCCESCRRYARALEAAGIG